jgi:type IV pilus assembly protein PilA
MQFLLNLRRRARGQCGFTLVELVVAVTIVGILIAIGVPTYRGYRDRAADRTAQANLRAAMPTAETYYNANETYASMDAAALRAIDGGLSESLAVAFGDAATFCLTDTISGRTWSVRGPDDVASGFKPNGTCA